VKALVCVIALVVPTIAFGQETGDPGPGAVFAEKTCSHCHDIKGAGPSPEPTAPPFQNVAITPGMTANALTVWLTTSHPTMPNIVLEPQGRDNVVAYILSLKK